MSSQLRKIGSHTMIYTAGIILGKVASFIMLPIYTHYLTPADYGILELLGMTIDVIGMITGVGLVSGLFKFYSTAETTPEKHSVISTSALGVVGLATASSFVGFLVAPELSRLVFGAAVDPLYLRLFFVIYFLQNFEYVPFLLIRAEGRSGLFVTLNTLKLLLTLSLNILFVVHLHMGVRGVLIGGIIAGSVVALGLSTYLIRRVGLGFSLHWFRQLLAFGRPIALWSIGSFVLVFSDRYFLNHYVSTAAVGIYSLAYKFAFMLSALAHSPFEMIWDAERYEIAKQPDAHRTYARVFLYMNVLLGLVGLAISLFVKDFLRVMSDPAFLSAYRLVPLIVAAQVVFTWGGFWNFGILITGKTRAMGEGAIFLVVVTMALNFALIPRFGMFGAAWATFIAYSVRFAWIYFFAQRHYYIPHPWHGIIRLYAILGGALAIHHAYSPEPVVPSVLWSVVLLATTAAAVFGVVLSASDRSLVTGALRRYLPLPARGVA